MASKTLIERIEQLPPDKRAELESLVESLASPTRPRGNSFPPGLTERIKARREALFREHGYFDTLPIIQELREHGGR
jgi:hypothetical protein